MKRLTLIALALIIVGCTAVVKDPDDTVATFNLKADQLQALMIDECVAVNGVSGCTPQPNLLECTKMVVEIRADGRTWVNCSKDGKVIHNGFARIDEGSPFRCMTNDDLGCQRCVDAFENVILDNCNRNTQSFRRPLIGGSSGEGGYLVEPGDGSDGKPTDPNNPPVPDPNPNPGTGDPNNPNTPTNPATPDGKAGGICDPKNAAYSYAHQLNKILNHEGLNFSWAPDLTQILDPSKKGQFYGSSGFSGANNNCVQFAKNVKSHIHQCIKKKNGECFYCWQSGTKLTCKCYRINLAALKSACSSVPAGCDASKWSEVMIQTHGLSNKWLFSSSYTTSFYGQVTPGTDGGTPMFPKCQGSPLVLDTAGNGIKPSAPADGVKFDLMGTGQLQTAWISGDDALLALDRDGNGRIDSGTELFGDITAGEAQDNGFGALAQLDANSDGKVDSKDPSYKKLVLWKDENRDGVSQRAELRSLATSGIKSLATGMSASGSFDKHGNDMRLQGSFTRTDGSSGLMVDVYFSLK
jgi:hypothetical protein